MKDILRAGADNSFSAWDEEYYTAVKLHSCRFHVFFVSSINTGTRPHLSVDYLFTFTTHLTFKEFLHHSLICPSKGHACFTTKIIYFLDSIFCGFHQFHKFLLQLTNENAFIKREKIIYNTIRVKTDHITTIFYECDNKSGEFWIHSHLSLLIISEICK